MQRSHCKLGEERGAAMSSDQDASTDDTTKPASSNDMWGAFKAGIDRAPRQTVPFILLIVAVVATIDLITFLNQDERQLPLLVAFGLLAAILIALVAFGILGRSDLRKKQRVVYRRVCPGELGDLTKDELLDRLVRIHAAALKIIRDAGTAADDDKVRSNLFVPTTSQADEGEICSLEMILAVYIPKTSLEYRLQFFVNQGVTGKVFTEGRAVGAFRHEVLPTKVLWRLIELPNGTPTDGAETATTDEQHQKLVDPELQWIVSFPLKIKTGDSLITMGVLNVDGLFTISDDLAMQLYGGLLHEVDAFAARLAKAPEKRFVKIVVEKFIDE